MPYASLRHCAFLSDMRACSENPDATYSTLLANNAERREKENGDGPDGEEEDFGEEY